MLADTRGPPETGKGPAGKGPAGKGPGNPKMAHAIGVCLALFCLTSVWPSPPIPSLGVPQLAVAIEDDPNPAPVPLCHKVTSPSVLNCANSDSMCVTAITPDWKCKLKTDGTGCKCE